MMLQTPPHQPLDLSQAVLSLLGAAITALVAWKAAKLQSVRDQAKTDRDERQQSDTASVDLDKAMLAAMAESSRNASELRVEMRAEMAGVRARCKEEIDRLCKENADLQAQNDEYESAARKSRAEKADLVWENDQLKRQLARLQGDKP